MAELKVDNVPEELMERLSEKAQGRGLTVSALVVAELTESLRRPTRNEVLDRIAAQAPASLREDEIVRAVRSERDSR